jgi:hypothetical protein
MQLGGLAHRIKTSLEIDGDLLIEQRIVARRSLQAS